MACGGGAVCLVCVSKYNYRAGAPTKYASCKRTTHQKQTQHTKKTKRERNEIRSGVITTHSPTRRRHLPWVLGARALCGKRIVHADSGVRITCTRFVCVCTVCCIGKNTPSCVGHFIALVQIYTNTYTHCDVRSLDFATPRKTVHICYTYLCIVFVLYRELTRTHRASTVTITQALPACLPASKLANQPASRQRAAATIGLH